MTKNNAPEINVQDLMSQIRHEVAQKKVKPSAHHAKVTPYIHEGIVLNRISENKECIPDKPKYTLAEFLEYQDADFIRSAYRGILRREPDAGGYEHYGNLLYTGKMSKIEILGRLRYSAEGRFCKVPVRGLLKPFLARSAFRLPVLGTTAAIANAVVKLPNIVRNQVSFENYTYRHQREHVEQINIIADQIEGAIAEIQKGFVSLAQTIDTQAISLEEANLRIQSLTMALDTKADNDQLTNLTNHLVNLIQSKAGVAELEQKAGLAQLEAYQAENIAQLQTLNSVLDTKVDKAVQGLTTALDTKVSHEQLNQLNNQLLKLIQNKVDTNELAITSQLLLAELEQKVGLAQLQNLTSALDTKAGNEQLSKLNVELVELIKTKADAEELATTSELLITELAQKVSNEELTACLDQKAEVAQLDAHKAENEAQLQNIHQVIDSKVNSASQDLTVDFGTKLNTATQELTYALDTKVTTAVQSLGSIIDAKAGNEQLSQLNNQLVNLIKAKADTTELASNREHLLSEIAQKTSATEQELQDIKRQINDQKHNILDQHRRLAVLLEEARKRLPEPFSKKQLSKMVEEEDHLLDAFYVSFEDQFRGTRADIKERAKVYLPAINLAKAGSETAPILDIGCGRGEWLELLKENELHAQGVDVNHVMVSRCEALGLEVINADAIDYLRTIKSNSLGAVTGMHIIEHIPFKRLIALFDEVLRVLKPGGIAIFETPNPENLIVGACNFYYDPTHLNPLPPEPMRFVMEARGFDSIEIVRLHPYPKEDLLNDGAVKVQQTVNELMYGPRDYALVAYKS